MITLEQLTFGYPHAEFLFSDLALELKPGNIYGLLGKNGAGKTTLLKIIAGLLFPSHGKCQTMGFEPRYRQAAFLQSIYFVPEDFHLPAVSIDQYKAIFAPFYPLFDAKLFQEALEKFELPKNHMLTALSFGQKKKFLMVFALATRAKLIIFDEPTNGLDIPSKSQFRKLIASSLSEDQTFIISTHQVKDVENLIDPLVILDSGKIIFNHSIEEISQKLVFTYQTTLSSASNILYSD